MPHKNVAVHKHYSGPRLTQNKTSASSTRSLSVSLLLCLSSVAMVEIGMVPAVHKL